MKENTLRAELEKNQERTPHHEVQILRSEAKLKLFPGETVWLLVYGAAKDSILMTQGTIKQRVAA